MARLFHPNEDHLSILRQGVNVWNQWRKDNPEERPYLNGADLTNASLRKVDLSRAFLQNAALNKADFIGANFSKADLFCAELKGAWLDGTNFHDSELGEADLSNASCVGANFDEAGLTETILIRTNLRQAKFQNSHLVGVDLHGSDLRFAKLKDANLSDSRLLDASFNGADLTNVDFSRALMGGTVLVNIDLSEVRGLDSVRHVGPSSLGIDTLYISSGKIPVNFLEGCGLPEEFVTQIPSLSLADEAIQFYSCFISYSHKDDEFAKRLYSRMRDEGLRVWYAPEEMKGGEKIHEQIFKAIQLHDRLLLLLSENSLQSEWVTTEIRKARKTEIEENRRKLFPIRLVDFETLKNWECFDADSGKDLAVEVREYFIPDFSNWKDHDSFEKSFDWLLRDLRASG
jgi:uncharacterized protein YjbI with pentapeptide repeats